MLCPFAGYDDQLRKITSSLKLYLSTVKVSKHKYNDLLKNIGSAIETGRSNALSALNEQILLTYWKVGRHIVEFEQQGSERAEYGAALINNLSGDLKLRYGKGFSRSNIKLMRSFYINYPKFQASGKFRKARRLANSQKARRLAY